MDPHWLDFFIPLREHSLHETNVLVENRNVHIIDDCNKRLNPFDIKLGFKAFLTFCESVTDELIGWNRHTMDRTQ